MLLRGRALLPPRRIASVGVRLLLAIELLEEREPLLRRRGHEAHGVRLLARLVQLAHSLAEDLLVFRLVRVGDHERHEGAGPRRLRPRGLRLGKHRLRHLIEERDVLGGELADALVVRGRTPALAGGEQRGPADEADAAEDEADAADGLTAMDDFARVFRCGHRCYSTQRLRRLSSLTAWSAARAVSAM